MSAHRPVVHPRRMARTSLVEELREKLADCRRERTQLQERTAALESGALVTARRLRAQGWSSRWIAEKLAVSAADARRLVAIVDREG